jgi:hypothetical protein
MYRFGSWQGREQGGMKRNSTQFQMWYSHSGKLQFMLSLKGDTTLVIGKWEEKCDLEDLGIEGLIPYLLAQFAPHAYFAHPNF